MWPRLMITLACIFIVLLVGLFLLIKYLEHTSVFFPSPLIQSTPDQIGLTYEDLYITTVDGVKINAWLAKSSPEAATIMFAHGNAGTMGERVMRMKFFHDLGLNVCMFDYRGYARSQGKPSEQGIYLDAQSIYDYLKTRPDINPDKLIAYGSSLGGVVMVDLASKRKVAALVVESSFTSAKDMAHRLYPLLPAWMMSIKFDSLSKISKIDAPKLFLHSKDDHTVPYAMGQKLYAAARDPKAFIDIYGGHNDGGFLKDPRVLNDFKNFLKGQSLL
jgi:fermentation-respiration switch protein FrsA (DUF1100 family)